MAEAPKDREGQERLILDEQRGYEPPERRAEEARRNASVPRGFQDDGSGDSLYQQMADRRADAAALRQQGAGVSKGGAAGGAPAGATPKGTGPGGLGITAGEYEDYTAAAKQAFGSLGILGRDPTDAEIVQFAKAKVTPEGIADYYKNLPELVSRNPGLPFGLSKQTYDEMTKGYKEAWGSMFGGDLGSEGSTREERQSSLTGRLLTDRVSRDELASVGETFRQERGRAPTATEFYERRNRPQQRSSGSASGVASGGGGEDRGKGGGGGDRANVRPAISA